MFKAHKGDIVYVKRKGYRHFGIYAGNDHVIHYHKERHPLLCDGIVTETSVSEFMSDSDTLYVLNGMDSKAKYSAFDWIIKRLWDGEITTFPPGETVERARSKIGEHGYNLLLNNCEHFSFWCKTGIAKSTQIDEILSYLQPFIPHPPAETAKTETAKAESPAAVKA